MGRMEFYHAKLAGLRTGARHPQLLGIARAGRLAGVPSEQVDADIHAAGDREGDPLTEREVADAVRKAEEIVPLGGDYREGRGGRSGFVSRRYAPPPAPPPPTAVEAGFVHRMVAAGERWLDDRPIYGGVPSAALYDLSPVQFPVTGWGEQAALMVEVLSQDFFGYTFAGEQTSARDLSHLHQAELFAYQLRSGAVDIPPQIIANQLTGGSTWMDATRTSPAHWSYATKAEVLHYRHAVVEFDGYKEKLADGREVEHPLPLDAQALFWLGCITEGTMPCLRTLVYSGSKSIHAVIRLLELRDLGAEWREVYAGLVRTYRIRGTCTAGDITAEELWRVQWKQLECLLHSSPDRRFHCDPACKDVTRQTRLAGHLRRDKGRRQALLWIVPPDPRDFPRPDEDPPEATEHGPRGT